MKKKQRRRMSFCVSEEMGRLLDLVSDRWCVSKSIAIRTMLGNGLAEIPLDDAGCNDADLRDKHYKHGVYTTGDDELDKVFFEELYKEIAEPRPKASVIM